VSGGDAILKETKRKGGRMLGDVHATANSKRMKGSASGGTLINQRA